MLKTIQVGDYTVTEMGTLQQVRLELFTQQVEDRINDKIKPIDNVELETALRRWPTVAACTTPLITMDEWTTVSLEVILPIQLAVRELNGNLFGDTSDSLEQSKKNGRKRPPKSPRM